TIVRPTMMKTMIVVSQVSLSVGQVTFLRSRLTWRKNSTGPTRRTATDASAPAAASSVFFSSAISLFYNWQGRRDSNPRPSVLETDALPAELHPFNVVSGAFAVSRLSRRNTSNRLADPPAFWSAQAKQYSRSSYFRILATTPAPTVR